MSFDAKSILEALVNGAQQPSRQPQGGGGLANILGKIMQGQQAQQPHASAPQAAGGGGLDDLLRNILGGAPAQRSAGGQDGGIGGLGDLLRNLGGQAAQAPTPRMAPAPHAAPAEQPESGGLGDILGQLQKQLGAGGQGGQGGGLMDVLGQILGQATQGVKEGAGRIDDATGASRHARDALGQATGKSPDELLQQLKDLIANNQVAAGAGLGGIGALVLGTKTGRSMAGTAAQLGALAMIGGLAYKAYQNYAAGRPLITGHQQTQAAPAGSGFEPQAVTQESATLYIRAMIGAAAADGRIDAAEQAKLLGSLKQAGVDSGAEEFLANELNNPASPADLAAAVRSPEEALQVFTAARIAVDIDTQEEHDYLVDLTQRLRLDPKLVQHLDAAAHGASA